MGIGLRYTYHRYRDRYRYRLGIDIDGDRPTHAHIPTHAYDDMSCARINICTHHPCAVNRRW